jgi:proteasome maturation protein
MRMETLRRQFGIAEPVRRGMEMRIVTMGEWRPACLDVMGLGSVHSDVLAGRDCELGWEDVFGAGREFRELPGFHAEMESRLRMNW